MISAGQAAFKRNFQLCPIFLTNGIAGTTPLPITSLLQGSALPQGLLGPPTDIDLDNYFANFQPVPGAGIINQEIAKYPFANQSVAANAVIVEPLAVSLIMVCPVSATNTYARKLAIMTSLQATLLQHNTTGGTYTVATPSYFYTNCLLRALTDATAGDTKISQLTWRWDFEQPLITLAQAQMAQNGLMSKLSNGTQINGQPSYSGIAPTVGNPPSLTSLILIPSGGAAAGGVSGTGPGGLVAGPV
jgi:hypothetical protein